MGEGLTEAQGPAVPWLLQKELGDTPAERASQESSSCPPRVDGYVASRSFSITKADFIPAAVSALRPSRGVGKGPVPPCLLGAAVKEARPGVELCMGDTA